MNAVVTALLDATNGLTAAKFYAVIVDVVPVLVFLIPIALGLYFFRRITKGMGRGKVKI